MCLAFGAERARRRRPRGSATCSRCSRRRGLAEKVRGLKKLKSIADSQPKTRPQRRPRRRSSSPATRSTSAACRSRPAGRATPAPFITLPAVITQRPAHRRPQRRHVPDAGARPAHDRDALADPQGRPRRLPARPTASSRSPSRSGSTRSPRTARARRCPKHVDELMLAGFLARRAGRARAGEDRRPRGPRQRRDRARGLHRAGRARPTKGPFGDHTGYYTPAEPFPVFHVTAMTMRRDAIYPSIVVGKPPQEDAWLGKATGADLPAGDPDERARDRRLRPAGRRRVPQLLHRLDPQELSRATRRR